MEHCPLHAAGGIRSDPKNYFPTFCSKMSITHNVGMPYHLQGSALLNSQGTLEHLAALGGSSELVAQ